MCGQFRQQSIFDQIKITNQIIVINMQQNLNHRYSSYHMIIKYVDFEPIHYVTNLYATQFFKVFSKFDFIFLSNILLI